MDPVLSTGTLQAFERITENIEKVMRGQSDSIKKLLVALISGGHVLLEDYPGTGKTTLAKALAQSLDASFKRIQFTPDLLPSDIVGVSVFSQSDQKFHYHEGPVFGDIVLADEINRASPRTQSALLEAMGEGHVTVDGKKRFLGELFFVIATQNPVEFHGTYPLPEAQMDRFAIQFNLGYISAEEETGMLSDQLLGHPLENLTPCITRNEILQIKQQVKSVRISDELKRYAVDLVTATRTCDGVQMGASPRASLALMKTAQARALIEGSPFVRPEDIRAMAVPVIAHRLVLNSEARFSGRENREIVQSILETIPVPV